MLQCVIDRSEGPLLSSDNQLDMLRQKAEAVVRPAWERIDEVSLQNHRKVLAAFQEARVAEYHFRGSTGYGYGDAGRETLDRVFAQVLGAEAALVRPHIGSGTHALSLALQGVLRPGDELLSATGTPYDTLQKVIGSSTRAMNSLAEWGITYRQVELDASGAPYINGILAAITPNTRVVLIQRSRGYQWRPSIPVASIGRIIEAVKAQTPRVICLVDNCYGELVETIEPTLAGADLIAGSLIKNLGGGLAPSGGYIAGQAQYVEMAANRLFAPGQGSAVGAWPEGYRLLFQGIFLAPNVVGEALKGAAWTAAFLQLLGLETSPLPLEQRTDIIQAVRLQTPERLIAFCQGLQSGSPVDSYVLPEPSGMPGYTDHVVMAGGTFVHGSSIELSADGPLRPPYVAYIQGGLSRSYVQLGVMQAVRRLIEMGELTVK